MLILSRKQDERIILTDRDTGKQIAEIVLVRIRGERARIGIHADESAVVIHRLEVHERLKATA